MINEELLLDVSQQLKIKGLTLATAESCTGGLLAHILTNISGSSEYFDRGVISYSNNAKQELLDVSENTLKRHGAVSEQTAQEMATGIKNRSQADIGIAITGIAGPNGGTKDKPVGLVYIAIATSKNILVKKFVFSGDRLQIKENTCNAALVFLLECLNQK
ncbi:MAG: CinA family protein [Euryarchaeota archaeon]|nr:CinA family protein [Euryarchaeota archaeon]